MSKSFKRKRKTDARLRPSAPPSDLRNRKPKKSPRARRGNHIGWFWSYKVDEPVFFESTLEHDFLAVATVEPDVRHVIRGAEPIVWWDGRQWRHHTPDFLVVGKDRVLDVEVKPAHILRQNAEMYRRIALEACGKGRRYLVLTEKQIRVDPRLSNSRVILTHAARHCVTPDDRTCVLQIARGTREFSINFIVRQGVLPYGRAYAAVLHLVAWSELTIDMSRPIDGDSLVRGCRS